jgi:nucleoside-diphosphate-sugar epimerase
MSSPFDILVTSTAGKQGGAVVRALLNSPTNIPCPYSILALTRNPSSPAARKLASTPNVSLIQGDFNNCASIFSKIKTPGQRPWNLIFLMFVMFFVNKHLVRNASLVGG